MTDIRKQIIIQSDSSQVQADTQKMSNSFNTLYENARREAQSYTSDLNKQHQIIDKLIAQEQKRFAIDRKSAFAGLKDEESQELSQTRTKTDKRLVKEDFKKLRQQWEADFSVKDMEVQEAKLLSQQNKLHTQQQQLRDIDDQKSAKKTSTFRTVAKKGTDIAKRSVSQTAGALGIGLGIFGIISKMISEADKLQRSLKSLDSVMEGIGNKANYAATNIGLTSSELNKFTIQVAKVTGGVEGSETKERAVNIAEFAKAFGLQKEQLLPVLNVERTGGGNVSDQLLNLLMQMNSGGAISLQEKNFAQLGEKIEYWSRLNQMQSEKLLEVMPESSAAILSAFQGTNLPILSDQRQLGLIQKFNDAIINPNNDFKKAFIFESLQRPKESYVETLKRQEQGIFGEGNLERIISSIKTKFGDSDKAVMATKELFGTSINVADELVKNLFNDSKKLEQFFNSFEDLNKIKHGSFNTKEEREKRMNEQEAFIRKKYGVDITDRASEKTAFTERTISQVNEVFAKMGTPLLEGAEKLINKLVVDKDGKGTAITKTMGILGDIASGVIVDILPELLKVTADGFNELVDVIEKVYTTFTKYFDIDDEIVNTVTKEVGGNLGEAPIIKNDDIPSIFKEKDNLKQRREKEKKHGQKVDTVPYDEKLTKVPEMNVINDMYKPDKNSSGIIKGMYDISKKQNMYNGNEELIANFKQWKSDDEAGAEQLIKFLFPEGGLTKNPNARNKLHDKKGDITKQYPSPIEVEQQEKNIKQIDEQPFNLVKDFLKYPVLPLNPYIEEPNNFVEHEKEINNVTNNEKEINNNEKEINNVTNNEKEIINNEKEMNNVINNEKEINNTEKIDKIEENNRIENNNNTKEINNSDRIFEKTEKEIKVEKIELENEKKKLPISENKKSENISVGNDQLLSQIAKLTEETRFRNQLIRKQTEAQMTNTKLLAEKNHIISKTNRQQFSNRRVNS